MSDLTATERRANKRRSREQIVDLLKAGQALNLRTVGMYVRVDRQSINASLDRLVAEGRITVHSDGRITLRQDDEDESGPPQ